jgi:hypothetical protein
VIEQGIIEDFIEDVQTLIAARSQLDGIFPWGVSPRIFNQQKWGWMCLGRATYFIPNRLDG